MEVAATLPELSEWTLQTLTPSGDMCQPNSKHLNMAIKRHAFGPRHRGTYETANI